MCLCVWVLEFTAAKMLKLMFEVKDLKQGFVASLLTGF